MGLLNSALQIGRTSLLGYEGAMQIVGNNVAGAASPDYTRLSPDLDPLQGGLTAGALQPGAGVALTGIQRNVDQALEARVRLAIGSAAAAVAGEQTLMQVEALFSDFDGGGLQATLSDFFAAFDEVQNTPEDAAIRDLAVTRAARLADAIRSLREELVRLQEHVDEQIVTIAGQADEIAREIARLNEEITTAEAQRSGPANGLRDQRDGLLRELGALMDVTVREQPNGTVNVYVGSETLIQGNSVRGLVAQEEVTGDTTRVSVCFADTNQQVEVHGGTLAGLLAARDQVGPIETLDRLAAALIADVNRIHGDGQGLVGFTSVTGANDVLATDVPLDSGEAGLAFPPRNGSFYIAVIDTMTGTPTAYRIDVDADGTSAGTTLASLVTAVNTQVQGVTASITSDNRLHLEAGDGVAFTFGYDGQRAQTDSSGVLAALGINTLFAGSDARDIAVNPALMGQTSLLGAATAFLSGDGSNAGRVAGLDSSASEYLGTQSITAFYQTLVNDVAARTAAAREDVEARSAVLESLEAQRESISGVNLDEEAISLVKYQRAYQGSARFIRAVDDLLTELLLLIR
jgi:flagellar hook-associated protein 1 FlgK